MRAVRKGDASRGATEIAWNAEKSAAVHDAPAPHGLACAYEAPKMYADYESEIDLLGAREVDAERGGFGLAVPDSQ